MAWTALGYDENTGNVRWVQNGQEQFLPQGQDPNTASAPAIPEGWNYVPAQEYVAPYYVNNTEQGSPLVQSTAPGQSFGSMRDALETLYIPYAGGNQGQIASLINQFPDSYSQWGINAGNAGQLLEQNFYDRLHNIDKNDWIDTIGQGALGALYGAAIGDFTGLFSMDNAMGNLFGGQSGPVASGSAPTQVGGWQWSGDPRFAGTTVDGVLQPSGQNWWNTDWGTEGLVDLGGASGGAGGITSSSLGGSAASAAASALGGSDGSSGGGSLTGALGSAAGAGSALSRILDGTATTSDWLSVGGTAGSTLLGLYGANQQTNALKDLANKYSEYGAPSRARYEAAMSPGFDITSIPGYQGALDTTSESILRKLSATGGNPFGNPGGLIEANKAIVNGTAMPAFNEYARLNANTGFGSSMNAAIPFQTAAINSDANSMNAIGSGIASLTTPKNSLQDLLKQFGGQTSGLSLV